MSKIRCLTCNKLKDETEFYDHPKTKDGKDHRCKKCQIARAKKQGRDLKNEVISMLGGRCACCGETERLFLSLDHVDSSGAEFRRLRQKQGYRARDNHAQYRDAKNNPANYQVLCHNCNLGRQLNGGICPHKS